MTVEGVFGVVLVILGAWGVRDEVREHRARGRLVEHVCQDGEPIEYLPTEGFPRDAVLDTLSDIERLELLTRETA